MTWKNGLEVLKSIGLKFANGVLLVFLWALLVWFIGFFIKTTYVLFLKGWNFL